MESGTQRTLPSQPLKKLGSLFLSAAALFTSGACMGAAPGTGATYTLDAPLLGTATAKNTTQSNTSTDKKAPTQPSTDTKAPKSVKNDADKAKKPFIDGPSLWDVVGTKKPSESISLIITPNNGHISLWSQKGHRIFSGDAQAGILDLPTREIGPSDYLEVSAPGHETAGCQIEFCDTRFHLKPLAPWQRTWQRATFTIEPALGGPNTMLWVDGKGGIYSAQALPDGRWQVKGMGAPLDQKSLYLIEEGGDRELLTHFTHLDELHDKRIYREGGPEIESATYLHFTHIAPLLTQDCGKAGEKCQWPSNLFVEARDANGQWQALSRPSPSDLKAMRWGPITVSSLRKSQIRIRDISGTFQTSEIIPIRYIQTREFKEGPEDSRIYRLPEIHLTPQKPSLHIALLDSEQLAMGIERATRRPPHENLLPRLVDLYLGQIQDDAYSLVGLQRIDGKGQFSNLTQFTPADPPPSGRQVESQLNAFEFYQSSPPLAEILSQILAQHRQKPWSGPVVLILEVSNRQDLDWPSLERNLKVLKKKEVYPIIVVYGPVEKAAQTLKTQMELGDLGVILKRDLRQDGLDGHFIGLTEAIEGELERHQTGGVQK